MTAADDSKFTLIPDDRNHQLWPDTYGLAREVIAQHHDHLAEAKIALAWMHEVKPDRDGHLVWGRTRKVGPAERIFHDHDFVITLNAAVWVELSPTARRALMDHELSHCGSRTNDDDEVVYYVRKHDLEEFVAIVRRYGLWKSDIEQFVNAAVEARARQNGAAAPLGTIANPGTPPLREAPDGSFVSDVGQFDAISADAEEAGAPHEPDAEEGS